MCLPCNRALNSTLAAILLIVIGGQIIIAVASQKGLDTMSRASDSTENLWQKVQVISPAELRESSSFGSSLSVDRDVLIIGAPNATQEGISSGMAFIFRYSNTKEIWVKEGVLIPESPEDDDFFGRSVSTSEKYAVVGNDRDDVGFNIAAGSVSVYKFDSKSLTWNHHQRLVPSDSHPNQNFGTSVSVDGDILLIGAQGDDQNGESSGAAYIFSLNLDTGLWEEVQKLMAEDGDDFDWFGGSLALARDSAVIGAMFDEEKGESSGSVYLFDRQPLSGEWVQQQKLFPNDAGPDMLFGNSVAISGGNVLVGSRWADSGGLSDTGRAYVFSRSDDLDPWGEAHVIDNPSPGSFDNFGFSVALVGSNVVIGSIWDRIDASRVGAAFLFRIAETGDVIEQAQKFSSLDPAEDDDFGASVALTETFIFVGVRGDDIGRGSAFVYHIPPIFRDGFEADE